MNFLSIYAYITKQINKLPTWARYKAMKKRCRESGQADETKMCPCTEKCELAKHGFQYITPPKLKRKKKNEEHDE
jgi:hypothetical protein